MATAKIFAGNCGFTTKVTGTFETDGMVTIALESDCPHITKIADRIRKVDPFHEISFQSEGGPEIIKIMQEECPHPSCPVFSGILRTVEISAGLALPTDITMEFEN